MAQVSVECVIPHFCFEREAVMLAAMTVSTTLSLSSSESSGEGRVAHVSGACDDCLGLVCAGVYAA